MATMEPQGPVYICFDATLQEQAVTDPIPIPDASRFAPPASPSANSEALRETASLLAHARWPLILADNAGRDPSAPASIQSLAELLGCGVVDVGGYFNFPPAHPLDVTASRSEVLTDADVILALDVHDLASATALSTAVMRQRVGVELAVAAETRIIHITLADYLQRSWASDVEKLLPVDVPIAASPASALPELISLCARELNGGDASADVITQRRSRVQEIHAAAKQRAAADAVPRSGAISRPGLYREMWTHLAGTQWSLVSGPYSQVRSSWEFTEAQQFAGACRGAGLGYGLGGSMGAALALKGSGRLCIDIQGDGDLLMTPSGLWTAAHHQIPLLVIVVNNHSYGNDEEHQRHMAVTRGRPVENKGIGIRIEPPQTDFASMARSFGVAGFGPVSDMETLARVLPEAMAHVRERGLPALVDVVIEGL